MESYLENDNTKNSEIKHYQKINILGDSGVGKSSLISLMEHYDDDDFQIAQNSLSESQMSIGSYNNSYSLVEQIRRIKILINKENNIYLHYNIYETNLDRYDYIKMNLDTLLLQTECIIIMWDKSKSDTFDNIHNLILTINAGIKDYKFRDVPIFVIQNKIDLNLTNSQKIELEDDTKDPINIIKKENKNVIFKDISLLDKDTFYHLVSDISRTMNMYKEKQKNSKDVVHLVKYNEKANQSNNDRDENSIKLKFILLGYTGVGKTTFFKYFLGEKNTNCLSTIGVELLTINAEINKEKITIELFDTAGQERYLSLSKIYIRNADGILLFFDVTNKESFESIDKWISDIKKVDKNDKEIIMIGNKI